MAALEQIQTSDELSFNEQAALLLKLKERSGGAEHQEKVRTLLRRFRKRDDLFARIAEEVDSLLASDATPQPSPPPVEPKRVTPNPSEERESTGPAAKDQPSVHPTPPAGKTVPRSGWGLLRLLFKGVFSLAFGVMLGSAVTQGLIAGGMIDRYDRGEAMAVLVPVGMVVMWLVLTSVGRRLKRFGQDERPAKPST